MNGERILVIWAVLTFTVLPATCAYVIGVENERFRQEVADEVVMALEERGS